MGSPEPAATLENQVKYGVCAIQTNISCSGVYFIIYLPLQTVILRGNRDEIEGIAFTEKEAVRPLEPARTFIMAVPSIFKV